MKLLRLNNAGKAARDSACHNLKMAIDQIETTRSLLAQEKGIGAEFYLESLDKFEEKVNKCIRNLRGL